MRPFRTVAVISAVSVHPARYLAAWGPARPPHRLRGHLRAPGGAPVVSPASRATPARGIHQQLTMDDGRHAELLRAPGTDRPRRVAPVGETRPLRADGWRQVAAGVDPPQEVLRVA